MKNHSPKMQEEFQRVCPRRSVRLAINILTPLVRLSQLLDQEQEADLNRMYLLLSRIPSGLDPLRERFEQHVKKAGLDSVEKIAGDAAEGVEPKAYVDALLSAHKRHADLVTKAFRGDQGFVASLDRVSVTPCGRIIEARC